MNARKAYPECRFELMSANADLLEQLGERPFDLVVSTEVVEHLYDPRTYALAEAGFVELEFRGAGRIPGLWMTVMAGTRPLS